MLDGEHVYCGVCVCERGREGVEVVSVCKGGIGQSENNVSPWLAWSLPDPPVLIACGVPV